MTDQVKDIFVSVIMPTYNSEGTIETSLKSIRGQDFDQSGVEILVIDGGSTDRTREIARQYNATVIDNPRRLPEAAKTLGIQRARGMWGAFLDSDESYIDMQCFAGRKRLLENHPDIKYIVSAGILNPSNAGAVTRYTNYIGDPFSNFVYNHYNGYDRIRTACRLYQTQQNEDGVILRFHEGESLPLYDAKGDFFSIPLARKCLAEADDPENVAATIFDRIVSGTHCAALRRWDAVIHDSRMTAASYASKLRWRVRNNLFGASSGVGYSSRSRNVRRLKQRQMLWILYSLSLICPFLEGIVISLKERDICFLSHWFWNEYVLLIIIWYIIRKVAGKPPGEMKIYGKR